jgi:hypothetical protein
MGEYQRRLAVTEERCTCVALRARYAELLRLRQFVTHIEDSTVGISVDERVLPMLPGANRVPRVTRRRRPKP